MTTTTKTKRKPTGQADRPSRQRGTQPPAAKKPIKQKTAEQVHNEIRNIALGCKSPIGWTPKVGDRCFVPRTMLESWVVTDPESGFGKTIFRNVFVLNGKDTICEVTAVFDGGLVQVQQINKEVPRRRRVLTEILRPFRGWTANDYRDCFLEMATAIDEYIQKLIEKKRLGEWPIRTTTENSSQDQGITKPKLTPAMQRYQEVKKQYPDAILLFRMGDFYELFFEDAETAARILGLTITTRDKNSESPVPMAGFPYHQLDNYLRKLIQAGYRASVCEQVEEVKKSAKKAK